LWECLTVYGKRRWGWVQDLLTKFDKPWFKILAMLPPWPKPQLSGQAGPAHHYLPIKQ
jgi:hypothetical protein